MRDLEGEGLLQFAQFGLDRDMEKWAPTDWGKPVLHLGPGQKVINGPTVRELEFPDYNFDVPYCLEEFDDDSVGGIYATHVLEHLADPRFLLDEVARVLAPGRPFNILVPHGQSLSFLQDLDHKTPFVIDTWTNQLNNPYYTKGKGALPLRVGINVLFGLKEANLAIITQLIKVAS